MHTFSTGGERENASSKQAKHELIFTSEREDGVINLLWWSDRTFDQASRTWACFIILTRISYVNDRMRDVEHEILTM